MKTAFVLAVMLAASSLPSPIRAAADTTTGSVLIETQTVRQGAITRKLIAFGTATPAIDASLTLNVQAEGRIAHIDVRPGQAVRAGQRLLQFDLSAAAASAHAQAVAALRLATEERTRIERLLAQQLATRDQLAQADKALVDARSALAAIERDTGGRPQRTLVAPFDGVVAAIPVAQGDLVAAGVALLTLTRSAGLVVTCGIETADLAHIETGQTATLSPLDGSSAAAQGTVARVGRRLNPATRLVDADIAVDSAALLEGAAYRVELAAGEITGWLVPRVAVLDDEEGAYLFQVSGTAAHRVAVRRIGVDGDTVAVDGELDPALAVVVSGHSQLDDGARVRMPAAQPGGSAQ